MRNFSNSAMAFKSLLTKAKNTLYIHEYQAYDILKKYQLPLVPVKNYLLSRAFEQAHQKTHMLLPNE